MRSARACPGWPSRASSSATSDRVPHPSPVRLARVHADVLRWYAVHARPLPWRAPGTSPWGVYVSEIMAQQTPVARVEPVWREWLTRWPTPADLAAATPGDAVRAWGRLGYPRRALRLHDAARVMVDRHDGQVPTELTDLLALPGVAPTPPPPWPASHTAYPRLSSTPTFGACSREP